MRLSQSGRSCAAMALALAGPSAAAELLPILNPGFELLNVSLRPGEQTNGAGGVPLNSGLPQTPVNTRWQFPFSPGDNTPQSGVLVPGWRTASPGSGSLAGVLNPDVTFGGTPWMTGFEGRYVGAAQAAFMSQTINRRLAPNTRYTLSFLAGIGITDSEYTPLLRLLATPDLVTFPTPGQPGIDSLAFVPFDGIIRRPDFGTMIPYSISYTSPEVLPPNLDGKYLAITFLGSDGFPRVVYDDFRLEATRVPGPGPLLIAGLAPVAMRRRR